MIYELQMAGVTLERIAEGLGMSVRMVCYLKATGAEPRHAVGEKLKEMHTKHVSRGTVQTIS